MRYDEPRQVRIPVRVVNGDITYFYSGVPFRMREGAIGDLIVDEEEVGSRLRSLLQRQSVVKMFEAGTTLWVNVQPHGRSRIRLTHSISRRSDAYGILEVAAVQS